MKATLIGISSLICIQLVACSKSNNEPTSNVQAAATIDTMKLTITIGTNIFTATLYNNATVKAFKSRLPMTINMTELNGNEKYVDLPAGLPADASNPGAIQSGDLMLYGSNTLVLFYKSFSTTYSYTPMGRVDDAAGLAAALGAGNSTVRFELK